MLQEELNETVLIGKQDLLYWVGIDVTMCSSPLDSDSGNL
jgi:hypothetical protein